MKANKNKYLAQETFHQL